MEEKGLFELLRRMHEEAERHFYDLFLEAKRGFEVGKWYPPADVFETERALVIRLEVPGTSLEDIKIVLAGQKLKVHGTKKDHFEGGPRRFHQAEIVFGEFERSFLLPWAAKEDEIRATYKDGILTIILRKPEPKSIKVEKE